MSTSTSHSPPVVVHGAGAELIEFPGGSSIKLLADSLATGGKLSVHRARLRNGAAGASPHHHTTAAEVFYVLSGSVQLLLGEQLLLADEGDLAVVPPGMAHAFAAAPRTDAELLVAVTPGIERFDLFRRLGRISAGLELPGTLFEDQSLYDTYADDSPAWRQARTPDQTLPTRVIQVTP